MTDVDARPINVLSLCSGGGGLDLGVRLALPTARTVCYVEYEAFACEVLASRMEDKALDEAPLWSDLRTFDGRPWRGVVDLIIGGYPCQPFSSAGRRRGDDDPRHIWPDIARIIDEVCPSACFFENVADHLTLGFDTVCSGLDALGYRGSAGLFSAEEVGAPHRRERLFILAVADSVSGTVLSPPPSRADGEIGGVTSGTDSELAHADSIGWGQSIAHDDAWESHAGRRDIHVGDSDGSRLEGPVVAVGGGGDQRPSWPPGPEDAAGWNTILSGRVDLAPSLPKPAIHGDLDGITDRVVRAMSDRSDRLRLLGNGVVPQTAAKAYHHLTRNYMR